ncbi:TetR/AcrR family transcriptional regulator [Blastococcus sp. PRF04-17]|uniref:TetR/AcrR family transcriptional regulator n=1 Tax=Blastococcus sp. PRF04-17 TaxID=2933797 RepID=UPI001FF5AD3F|nr:TetR/AcrR family transcriptional regulator [Blastococcus sp. PRF04-17]UOY02398.1 TetR/AcrR family transcriptional regulator [Blastococcus sp. PRF04-17]
MARPFRQQADESILDSAAALFARRGFAKTSVQDVADAVGLSKAGLLHHFPSKDALWGAVLEQVRSLGERVLEQVQDMPAGPERDRRALEVLLDAAFGHPGLVALVLDPLTLDDSAARVPELDAVADTALRAFGVDRTVPVTERSVRVVGALAALAVLTLAAHAEDQTTAWRQHIVATCFDALGHGSSGSLPASDQET